MHYHNMQNNVTDCGIAVLKTVLQQFDRKLPRNFTEDISVGEGQGLSLIDLKNILKRQGIHTSAYEVSNLKELKNVVFPTIAIVDQNGRNHYVVIHGYNDKNGEITLSDPAEIEITKTCISEFINIFSGYMLCIDEVDSKKLSESKNELYTDIISSIPNGEKIKYSLVSVIKWGIPIALIFMVQYLFMFHIEKMTFSNTALVMLVFVFVSIGYYYLSLFYQKYKSNLEKNISRKMTMEFLISEIKIINTKKNTNDTEGIFWNIVISVLGILQKFYLKIDLVLISAFIGVVAVLNWIYALIILFFILAISIYSYKFKDLIKNRQVQLIGTSSEMSGCIQEMTQSSMDLKIFSDFKNVEQYCNGIYEKYEKVREDIGQEDMKMVAFYDMCSYIAMAVGLAIIFISYNNGTSFSSSSMVMAFYMTIFMIMTFKSTFQKWIEYQKSVNAIEYIEFMVGRRKEEEEKNILNFKQIEEVELKQIEIKIENKVILRNLDLKLRSGIIVGIQGENGSGKSTLAKTILGLLKPTKGQIKINGIELNDKLSNSDITKYISFYSSELYTYSDSVSNNISFNVLHDQGSNSRYSYMNELGLDYLLFLNGINISQGERQKILLDRCFEKNKSVYIFDEPGINLDYESHTKMIDMFRQLRDRGKIILIISHERKVLSCCDKCYQMSQGKLIKIGE